MKIIKRYRFSFAFVSLIFALNTVPLAIFAQAVGDASVNTKTVDFTYILSKNEAPSKYKNLKNLVHEVPASVSVGYTKILSVNRIEDIVKSITLRNGKIAISIAEESQNAQLETKIKGKPVCFNAIGNLNENYLLDFPIVTANRLSVKSRLATSGNDNIHFDSVKILNSSVARSQVLASGKCEDSPLSVTVLYTVEPGNDWVDIKSTFLNRSDTAVTIWIGDAINNDEIGQNTLCPTTLYGGDVIVSREPSLEEYHPIQPWIGSFGTSSQVFGIIYSGDFAEKFLVYANASKILSQKQITIQPNKSYDFSRKVVTISTEGSTSKAQAMRDLYRVVNQNAYAVCTYFALSHSEIAKDGSFNAYLLISNSSKETKIDSLKVVLNVPLNIKCDDPTCYVDLKPSETKEVTWNLNALSGGGNCIISVDTWLHEEALSFNFRNIFISGEGWYYGDNHTHSINSDGLSTIKENADAAKQRGLSFITCSDHNTVKQSKEVAAENSENFIAFVGSEISTHNSGHVLAMFCDQLIPWQNVNSLIDAQQVIDTINRTDQGKSFAFIAHPFDSKYFWRWPAVEGVKGYEVWNGFFSFNSKENSRAFALWDSKLKAGYKYYGIANSDAHVVDKVGDPHICAYIKNFTSTDIREAISSGCFYGTNGPDLRLSIDTVKMGGSYKVSRKKELTISFKSYSSYGIDFMNLIKNGEVFQRFSYPEIPKSVSEHFNDEAVAGDYYRLEVFDCYYRFAFSNPIFIVSSTPTGPTVPDSIFSSIQDVNENSSLTFYPNPASEVVNIKMKEPVFGTLLLFDVNGKKWIHQNLAGETEKKIDLIGVPKGIYIVKINELVKKLVIH
jgi:Secretion system C-terminal sorting domain